VSDQRFDVLSFCSEEHQQRCIAMLGNDAPICSCIGSANQNLGQLDLHLWTQEGSALIATHYSSSS